MREKIEKLLRAYDDVDCLAFGTLISNGKSYAFVEVPYDADPKLLVRWMLSQEQDKPQTRLPLEESKLNSYGNTSSGYVSDDQLGNIKNQDDQSVEILPCDPPNFERPRLVISLTGGGKQMLISHTLREVLNRGLHQCGIVTRSWLITAGSNCGIMKVAGELLGRQQPSDSRKKYVSDKFDDLCYPRMNNNGPNSCNNSTVPNRKITSTGTEHIERFVRLIGIVHAQYVEFSEPYVECKKDSQEQLVFQMKNQSDLASMQGNRAKHVHPGEKNKMGNLADTKFECNTQERM